ncbi:unnamed protein product [Linum trigynum]|uniref:Uncharacterized protein n=1 Tax=Linum trigynum TaxID=586398 RepID=A0AAV2EY86_9ROSI
MNINNTLIYNTLISSSSPAAGNGALRVQSCQSATKSGKKNRKIIRAVNEGKQHIEDEPRPKVGADLRRDIKELTSQRKSIPPPPKPPEITQATQPKGVVIKEVARGSTYAQAVLGRRRSYERQKKDRIREDLAHWLNKKIFAIKKGTIIRTTKSYRGRQSSNIEVQAKGRKTKATR